jgi:hypothetical protein
LNILWNYCTVVLSSLDLAVHYMMLRGYFYFIRTL